MVFHNRRANPTPAKFYTHNFAFGSRLELLIPALILLVIAFFSFPALRYEQTMPEADVTIKTTGFQWYWGYEYVDHWCRILQLHVANARNWREYGYTQDLFLLATDTAMVVPVRQGYCPAGNCG